MRNFPLRPIRYTMYLIVVLIIVALVFYENAYHWEKREFGFTLERFLSEPQKYGDYRGERFGAIAEAYEDHFYFSVGDKVIKVMGKVEKPWFNEVTAHLEFRKDGTIQLLAYHNYKYNFFLYIVSAIALGIFAWMFFCEWKLTRRGFEARELLKGGLKNA